MRADNSLRRMLIFAALAAGLALRPAQASADRRYFLESYTPYLAPAGEMELETILTAKAGKQDTTLHTGWEPRFELEYAVTERLTVSALLIFSQPPGEALHYDSPALEFIYQLAQPGRLLGDPAAYLEVSETGEELELEPKLLLAHRIGRWVSAVNLIGEFEFRHDNEEKLASGETLHHEFKGEIAGGLAYELSPAVAMALETRYRSEYPNFGARADAVFSLGPSLNLQLGKAQLAIGVLPQLWGYPQTSGRRNLVDFEKTQIRAILGIEL